MPKMLRLASTVTVRAAVMAVPNVAVSVFIVVPTPPGAAAGSQFASSAQLPAASTFHAASAAPAGRAEWTSAAAAATGHAARIAVRHCPRNERAWRAGRRRAGAVIVGGVVDGDILSPPIGGRSRGSLVGPARRP